MTSIAVCDLKRPRDLRATLDKEHEVMVTKDGRPFATLAPIGAPRKPLKWPDLAARRGRLFPRGTRGKPLSEIIDEGRGER